ncbi:proline and serine-rich protein 2 isoform X2 [Salarias fasciatus]|uniref:proline and serine-rich protein 2 isoform X2 n=1 Tax=Salarias fasciatus TaxID=181472 RepID=UPI00117672F4|nr:proline and serine-rich protein 2 isoform X2 [Salarias fasciatus]
MDVRLQGNSQLHFAVNGGAAGPNARPADDTLHFLTQEEKDCIRFFENTIDSLEENLEDARTRTLERPPARDHMDGPPASASGSGAGVNTPAPFTSKDQDIIDLVRPDPDLVPTRDHFSFSGPDFQSLIPAPESHFEVKPRWDPAEGFSPDYSATDPHTYHPPGCVPTPVLIAQKIAENRGGGASGVDPSSILRRISLESDKPQGGPPTSAKPTRLPANISMVLGNRDQQAQAQSLSQSLANVNIQERRAQMLANLSGTSHPLLQDNPSGTSHPLLQDNPSGTSHPLLQDNPSGTSHPLLQDNPSGTSHPLLQDNPSGTSHPLLAAEKKTRNVPTRSISFRDPTPDKSRMEALSKLGLNRSRAMSGGPTLFDGPDGNSVRPPTGADAGARLLDPGPALMLETPPPSLGYARSDGKPEVLRSDSRRSYEEGSPQPSPSPTPAPQTGYHPSPLDHKPAVSPPPEVTSIEINSYGGKSMVVNPSVTPRSESSGSPTPPDCRTVSMSRTDLPDILSSHIDRSQPAPAGPEPPPGHFSSYGGRSLHITPAGFGNRRPAPPPAPRPPRHSHQAQVTQQLAASRALSPDHKRKPNLFRPQSITVEFCGRGPTDESRRAALRKLGLLNDS